MNLLKYYDEARNFILDSQYKAEMEWCENRPPFNDIDAETFFFEYVYVVLNAGMKEQIARKMYERYLEHLNCDVIGHPGKRSAIKKARQNYKEWFQMLKNIQDENSKIDFFKSLPWIGDITKYHLARNIGIDTVKPDRHLVRLAEQFGYDTPMDMCLNIQEATGERLGVIDVVLWRYCNLNGSIVKEA